MSGDSVLPGETPTCKDWKEMSSSKGRTVTSVAENEEEEVVMVLATSPAWVRAKEELARLDGEGKAKQYNTAWIRQKIGGQETQSLGGLKIPVLLCLVKSLDLECSNPPCKLVDQHGEVSGILHKDVLDNYGDVVQVNSVLLLRKVVVIVTACKQYVNISCDNLVAVFKDSEMTQVADLPRRDLGHSWPMRKGRTDNSEHLASFFNPSSSRCEASSPSARISSTYEGGREGSAVAPANCYKPTSSVNLTMIDSHTNEGNSSIRMPPPPSQMTVSRSPAQTSMVRQGQTPVRSSLTATPMTHSSTQLPLSFPTPPVFNFGQHHAPVGASHPQRLNTPAPSQVFNH